MTKDKLDMLMKDISKFRAEGMYKETIEGCYELLNESIKIKEYKYMLGAYANLIAAYYSIGDIKEAFDNVIKHKDICENHGDEIDRLASYNSMFLIYEYNKEIDKAKSTLEKTIVLGRKLKKYNILSNAYSNYSHICLCGKEYEEALEMGNIGLEMARLHDPNSIILEVRVKLNIAEAYIGLNDFETSKKLIDEILNAGILDAFLREKAQCYDLLGKWYSRKKMYKESFEAYTQAKALAESNEDIYFLKSIQEERCKLCELMEDIKTGYVVQKELIELLNVISKKELKLNAMKLEIKYNFEAMHKKANYDYLTGVYNRYYIESITNDWLARAYKTGENIIFLMFDVDKFKAINDEYGHLFGDEVIRSVGKICSKLVKKTNIIGRYGGDEFLVILRDASIDNAKKLAKNILNSARQLQFLQRGKSIKITLSIGIADSLSCGAVEFADLFHAADVKLYMAKKLGRDQFYI